MSREWDEIEKPEEDLDNSSPLENAGEHDIQELLDTGYEQLDGFVNWLEENMHMDARTAQQDCLNAESLLDYLPIITINPPLTSMNMNCAGLSSVTIFANLSRTVKRGSFPTRYCAFSCIYRFGRGWICRSGAR